MCKEEGKLTELKNYKYKITVSVGEVTTLKIIDELKLCESTVWDEIVFPN